MKTENKIRKLILAKHAEWNKEFEVSSLETDEEIEKFFVENNGDCQFQDATEAVREGQVETKIECDWSRHYESKSVASKMDDGSWIGWTYWYGGGKHGEPSAVEWMEHAYELECKESQQMVTVREFKQVV